MQIAGKKAVIVGGASGMAKSSAEMLRERGASIAILDLPTSAGAEVAKALGGSFHPVDVTDEKAVERASSTPSKRSAASTSRSTPRAVASRCARSAKRGRTPSTRSGR